MQVVRLPPVNMSHVIQSIQIRNLPSLIELDHEVRIDYLSEVSVDICNRRQLLCVRWWEEETNQTRGKQ